MSLPAARPVSPEQPSRRTFRFGLYEFDGQAGILTKDGIPLRLSDQPARVLTLLLERGGELVTRDELRNLLWADETFVQFDGALNSAIRKIRQALHDDADRPRYLETIPRRGYRFIAAVETAGGEPAAAITAEPVTGPPEHSARAIPPPGVTPARNRWFLPATALGIVLVFVASWIGIRGLQQSSSSRPVRYSIALPPDQSIPVVSGRSVAISPDGQRLIYRAVQDQKDLMFSRRLESDTPELLARPAGFEPVFSVGGDQIFDFTHDGIRILDGPGKGNLVQRYPSNRGPFAAARSESGELFFSRRPNEGEIPSQLTGIHRWRPGQANSLPVRLPATADEATANTFLPQQVLDGGRILIYSRVHSPADRAIYALNLETGKETQIVEPGMGGRVTPNDRFLYYWAGNILAAPIDRRAWKLKAPPVVVLRGVSQASWSGGNLDLATNGTVAYLPEPPAQDHRLVWVDFQGKETPLPIPPAPYLPLDLSKDGRLLLLSRLDSSEHTWTVWVLDLHSGESAPVTGKSYTEPAALWSPDGSRFVVSFAEDPKQLVNLYVKPPLRDAAPQRLTRSPYGQFPEFWSAAQNVIWFTQGYSAGTGVDIWKVNPADPRSAAPAIVTPLLETHPTISPDGNWLAYVASARSGVRAVVRPSAAAEPLLEIPGVTAQALVWSSDGGSILIRSGRRVIQAEFIRGAQPRIGRTATLFEGDYVQPTQWLRNTILHPDGKRFLLAKEEGPAPAIRRIEVITNWISEVEAQVPLNP